MSEKKKSIEVAARVLSSFPRPSPPSLLSLKQTLSFPPPPFSTSAMQRSHKILTSLAELLRDEVHCGLGGRVFHFFYCSEVEKEESNR